MRETAELLIHNENRTMSKKDKLFPKFVKLRIDGKSLTEVAKELDVSKQTLINWSKEEEVQDHVRFARQMRVQACLHDLKLNGEAQATFYANLYKKIQDEVLSRDLSNVSTSRLIHMMEKVDERLRKNIKSERFLDSGPLEDPFKKKEFDFNPME
jgi:transposase-like protein